MSDQIAEKLCPRCKKIKWLIEFYRNRSRPDGLDHYCKECHEAVRHLYGPRRKTEIATDGDLVLCIHCKEWKPKTEMGKAPRPSGVQSRCKECFAALIRQRRADERAAMTDEEVAEQKRQRNEYTRQWYRRKSKS